MQAKKNLKKMKTFSDKLCTTTSPSWRCVCRNKSDTKRTAEQDCFQEDQPLWRRSSPGLCFLAAGFPFAVAASSFFWPLILKRFIIFSTKEAKSVMTFHTYK